MDDNKLRDILYRHAVAGRDIGQELANEFVSQFLAVEADLTKEIAARYALIEANGFDKGPKTTARLEDMIKAVREVRQKVYEPASKGLIENLNLIAQDEARFAAGAVRAAGGKVDFQTTIPSNGFIKNLILTSPIAARDGEGILIMPWLDFHNEAVKSRLEGALRIAAFEGQTTAQVVKRIAGTKDTPGILETTRKDAATIALTASSTVQNGARLETFRRMKSIKYFEWSAILDSHTSTKCQQLSGQIFPKDEPHPVPPAHPRCRSILIPRRDNDGNKHQPFGEWLRDQPEAVQDEILKSKARADVFRNNPDFDFQGFFREGGGYKSLAELRAYDERLFAEGGVKSPGKPKRAPEPPALAPTPERAPERVPEPPKRFTTPINPDVNANTIEVRPMRDVKKSLTAQMARNAADPRYVGDRSAIRGVKVEDFGKASISNALSDEAASTLAALMPEIDALSDAFNIPRLRGTRIVDPSTTTIMDMGDGTLGLNARYLNSFAAPVGADPLATAQADLEKIIAKLEAVRAELDAARVRYEAQNRLGDFYADYSAKMREAHTLSKRYFEAREKVRRTPKYVPKPVSTWKVGDPVREDPRDRKTDERPYNTEGYFEGIDKLRLVLFHEMAHHTHDFFNNRGGWANRQGRPPVITELAKRFEKFKSAGDKASFERAKHFPSDYAMTNHVEWWAENFALYFMGRKDLVEPELAELIERMLDYAATKRTN